MHTLFYLVTLLISMIIGISHFGLDPNCFPMSCIRFDTFHLHSSITRQLLSTLRTFIFAQTFECQREFENILLTAWNKYFVFIWSANKPFTSLKGKEILAFIKLLPTVVQFITSNFMETSFLVNLSSGLSLWEKISAFIHRTLIFGNDDTEDVMTTKVHCYEQDMVQFKKNLTLFYHHGSQSFLTKKTTGDRETFYMHTLRFYLPHIVDDTWQ